MDATLRVTPLNRRHPQLGALMAPFGGWEMPIQYQSIIAEHGWCRRQAALFDVCHMGEFLFRGDLVKSGLEELFTFSLTSLPVGRSRYGFLLNEAGGVIDDLIAFRLAPDRVMIVVNAATIENDFTVIRSRLRAGLFTDITNETGKLDLQGPLARQVLADLLGGRIEQIPFFHFITLPLAGGEAIVSRTGYTGELGYEIFLPAAGTGELWELLLGDRRVKPAGLGARDLLRLEVGYPLNGQDLDESITPLEAGLEMFVNFGKEFVGRDALLAQREAGLSRFRVAFRVNGRRTPRRGYDILCGGERVGSVTSGAFSPMLGCGIGLGLVTPRAAEPGTVLTIGQGRVSMEAVACGLPFYDGGTLRA